MVTRRRARRIARRTTTITPTATVQSFKTYLTTGKVSDTSYSTLGIPTTSTSRTTSGGGGGGGGYIAPTSTQQQKVITQLQKQGLTKSQASAVNTQAMLRARLRQQRRPPTPPPAPRVRQRRVAEYYEGRLKPAISKSVTQFAETPSGKIIDVVGGGVFTKREFKIIQEKINKDVGKFNTKYEGRELSQEAYGRALVEQQNLEKRQKNLEQSQEAFKKTTKGKISKVVYEPMAKKTFSDSKKDTRYINQSTKYENKRIEKAQKIVDKFEKKPVTKYTISQVEFNKKVIAEARGNISQLKNKENPYYEREFSLAGLTLLVGGEVLAIVKGLKGVKAIKSKGKLGGYLVKDIKGKTVGKVTKSGRFVPSSKAKLKKIEATRKRLRKYYKKTKVEKKLKRFEKQKIKAVKLRRKKLRKYYKKTKVDKKLKKFEQQKLKAVKLRRKKIRKFYKKTKVDKKLKKFEKQKLKRIKVRRKKLRKFYKTKKVKKKLKKFEQQKLKALKLRRKQFKKRTSPRYVRKIRGMAVQKIKLRGKVPKKVKAKPFVPKPKPLFTYQKVGKGKISRELPIKYSPNRQVLLQRNKLVDNLKKLDPKQKQALKNLLKKTPKEIAEFRFKYNNRLIQQQKDILKSSSSKLGLKRFVKEQKQLAKKYEGSVSRVKKVKAKSYTLNKNFRAIERPTQTQRNRFRTQQKLVQKQFKLEYKKLSKVSGALSISLFGLLQAGLLKSGQVSKTKLAELQKLAQPQAQSDAIALAQLQALRVTPKKLLLLKTGLLPRPLKPAKPKYLPLGRRKKRSVKKLSKAVLTFNVYAKVGKKLKKINSKPLSRASALDKGSYAIDHTTARTFKITPAGKRKKVYYASLSERGHFTKTKYKYRPYRIKKGKKYGIIPKYIEKGGKRGFILDTRGEKKGLSISKYLKRGIKKPIRRKTIKRTTYRSRKPTSFKRRYTPTKRKVMLKNLAKARRVRMKNLKGGKR